MNYDEMPREELIAELDAWRVKYDARLQDATVNAELQLNEVLTKKYKKKYENLNCLYAKAVDTNRKTLKECLQELLTLRTTCINHYGSEYSYGCRSVRRLFKVGKKETQHKYERCELEKAVQTILEAAESIEDVRKGE